MSRVLLTTLFFFSFCVLNAFAADEPKNPLAKWGEKCGGTPPILCEAGLECSGPSGVCEKVVGRGEKCGGTPAILCKEGLQCSGPSGVCEKVVGEGEKCGGTPAILCKEGLQCSGPSGTCQKAQ
jgi:hypothetical protein